MLKTTLVDYWGNAVPLAVEQVSAFWRRFGGKGLQLVVLGYLVYRYLRAFVGGEKWAVVLWDPQQPQFNLDGISVPYIAMTISSPVVVLLLDHLTRQGPVDAAQAAVPERHFLSLLVLGLAVGFVWLSWAAWDTGSFAYVREITPGLPFAVVYTLISLGVGMIVVRSNRGLKRP